MGLWAPIVGAPGTGPVGPHPDGAVPHVDVLPTLDVVDPRRDLDERLNVEGDAEEVLAMLITLEDDGEPDNDD